MQPLIKNRQPRSTFEGLESTILIFLVQLMFISTETDILLLLFPRIDVWIRQF